MLTIIDPKLAKKANSRTLERTKESNNITLESFKKNDFRTIEKHKKADSRTLDVTKESYNITQQCHKKAKDITLKTTRKTTTSCTKKKRNLKVDKHKSLQLEPGQGSHCNLTALLDLYDTVDLKDAQSLLLHEF